MRGSAAAGRLDAELGAEVALLKPRFERAEEAGRVGAIDQPMIIGE